MKLHKKEKKRTKHTVLLAHTHTSTPTHTKLLILLILADA